ncbi:MAG: hypothetical protein Q8Q60_01325 [Candidatus Chromulinivorax sp.]|nr:hypothetical protein [Candidatus Chromulinivorax sp.]
MISNILLLLVSINYASPFASIDQIGRDVVINPMIESKFQKINSFDLNERVKEREALTTKIIDELHAKSLLHPMLSDDMHTIRRELAAIRILKKEIPCVMIMSRPYAKKQSKKYINRLITLENHLDDFLIK